MEISRSFCHPCQLRLSSPRDITALRQYYFDQFSANPVELYNSPDKDTNNNKPSKNDIANNGATRGSEEHVDMNMDEGSEIQTAYICNLCMGVLDPRFVAGVVAHMRARLAHERFDTQSLAVSVCVPVSCLVREFFLTRPSPRTPVSLYCLKETLRTILLDRLDVIMRPEGWAVQDPPTGSHRDALTPVEKGLQQPGGPKASCNGISNVATTVTEDETALKPDANEPNNIDEAEHDACSQKLRTDLEPPFPKAVPRSTCLVDGQLEPKNVTATTESTPTSESRAVNGSGSLQITENFLDDTVDATVWITHPAEDADCSILIHYVPHRFPSYNKHSTKTKLLNSRKRKIDSQTIFNRRSVAASLDEMANKFDSFIIAERSKSDCNNVADEGEVWDEASILNHFSSNVATKPVGSLNDADQRTTTSVVDPSTCSCELKVNFYRTPLMLAGRYNKYSRNLHQSYWRSPDGVESDNVERFIRDPALSLSRAEKSTFMSSGREDIDVRMLGTGRPFALSLDNPRRKGLTLAQVKTLELEMNVVSSDVQVSGLSVLTSTAALNVLKTGEDEKVKHYSALCHSSQDIPDEAIERINRACLISSKVPNDVSGGGKMVNNNSLSGNKDKVEENEKDLEQKEQEKQLSSSSLSSATTANKTEPTCRSLPIKQWTPLRVVHRRALTERTRHIHSLHATRYGPASIGLRVSTSAGTYVKEFVTGDLGRTTPSLSTIAGLQAPMDILELDVEDVELEWPPIA